MPGHLTIVGLGGTLPDGDRIPDLAATVREARAQRSPYRTTTAQMVKHAGIEHVRLGGGPTAAKPEQPESVVVTVIAANAHDVREPPTAGKFELYKDKSGKFRFRLKASNGEIIAVGEGYESKASAEEGIASVQKNAADAKVVDLTEITARQSCVGPTLGWRESPSSTFENKAART